MLGEETNNNQEHDGSMQAFSIDELCDIFEGDDSAGVDLTFDGESLSFEETTDAYSQQNPQPSSVRSNDNAGEGATETAGDKAPAAKAPAKGRGKRRRQSIKIDIDRGLPPPSWHSEAADKPHRQSMVVEM